MGRNEECAPNGALKKTALASLLSLGLLTGCDEGEITKKPPERSSSASFQTKKSTIGAMASVPLASLTAILNAKLPASFHASGSGDRACQKFGPKGDFYDLRTEVCADTRFDIQVNRSADATIAAIDQQTLRLSFPVTIGGDVGLRGDLARIIGLHAKNIRAGLNIQADIKPQISEDWCPVLDLSVGYHWTDSPKIEVIGNVWVDVTGQVESKLNEQIPQLVSSARNIIDCGEFRSRVASIYKSKSFPIPYGNNKAAYLNVQPTDVGFSGLMVESGDIKVAATVDVNAEIATASIVEEPFPLPKLKRIPAGVPRLAVNLPVRVPYSDLSRAISTAIKDKDFRQSTQAGEVSLKLSEVKVYPSGSRLVLGVRFDADLPGSIFNSQGWVYLYGTPYVVDGNKILIHDIGFAEVQNQKVWDAVAVVFRNNIKQALEKNALVDLRPQLVEATNQIEGRLTALGNGAKADVKVAGEDLSLGRLAVAKNELAMEVVYEATVSVAANLQQGVAPKGATHVGK